MCWPLNGPDECRTCRRNGQPYDQIVGCRFDGRRSRRFRLCRLPVHNNRKHVDRRRNIFDRLQPHVFEADRQLTEDGIIHGFRNANATRLRQGFESRRDIDAVAKQIAFMVDHVADRQTDAVRHLTTDWIRLIANTQTFLNAHSRAQCINRAWKLCEYAIACRFENAAASFVDLILEQSLIVGETAQRFFFVFGNKAAVSGDVCCEDGCNFTFQSAAPLNQS